MAVHGQTTNASRRGGGDIILLPVTA